MAANDVVIPKPVTSGAIDNPDAPQSGAVAFPPLPTGFSHPSALPPLPAGFSHPTGDTGTAATTLPAQKLDMTNDQPSSLEVLLQPTEKTDAEYGGYKGLPGIIGASIHGANDRARGATGAITGGLSTLKAAAGAWSDPHAEVGDTVLPDPHVGQIPGRS